MAPNGSRLPVARLVKLGVELERYLEMAMNHLHDLWVIQAWLEFPEDDFIDHESLMMNLLMDAMARCGRILSPENINFLPRPLEAVSPPTGLSTFQPVSLDEHYWNPCNTMRALRNAPLHRLSFPASP